MSMHVYNCPFCNHDDVEIDEVGIGDFAVTCPECQAIGPIEGSIMNSIAAWNKATRPAAQPKETEHDS